MPLSPNADGLMPFALRALYIIRGYFKARRQRRVAFVLRSIRPRDFITPLIAVLIISFKSLISCSNDSAL